MQFSQALLLPSLQDLVLALTKKEKGEEQPSLIVVKPSILSIFYRNIQRPILTLLFHASFKLVDLNDGLKGPAFDLTEKCTDCVGRLSAR